MKTLHVSVLALLAAFFGASSAQKKIVCYYGSWATYRVGNGQFSVENIDPFLCTHLIYSFVGIGKDGKVTILDAWNDLSVNGGKGAISRFNALRTRNPNLKTIIAIGGWSAGSETFSLVVNNAALRKTFVNNVIAFLKQYNFNGFDLDWEYPVQRGGSSNDKAAFNLLIQELRTEFDKYGYSLSAAVPASRISVETSFDVVTLGKYLDFINVMTYDLHGSWDPVTGHNAPLYARTSETGNAAYLNVDSSIQFWIEKGVPRNKLILGVPSYGRTWSLQSTYNIGVGAPATGPGNAGQFTKEPGMLGYNELCANMKQGGWVTKWDAEHKVPYAIHGNQWLSYDNPDSIKIKANYAVQQNLGGVMVWSIDTDDFLGVCDGTKFPILRAIKNVFGEGNSYAPGKGQNDDNSREDNQNNNGKDKHGQNNVDAGDLSDSSAEICKTTGYAQDPNDCSKFYYCSLFRDTFVKYPFSCPSGLAFDTKLQVCAYKYLVDCS